VTRTKLPFSRTLAAILADPSKWPLCVGTSPSGRRLQVWVFAGSEAWEFSKSRHDRYAMVLVPPGEPAAGFDFSLLANCTPPILLQHCGSLSSDAESQIARAIIRDGGRRVLAIPTLNRWIATQ